MLRKSAKLLWVCLSMEWQWFTFVRWLPPDFADDDFSADDFRAAANACWLCFFTGKLDYAEPFSGTEN